jgi:hypothetical protein
MVTNPARCFSSSCREPASQGAQTDPARRPSGSHSPQPGSPIGGTLAAAAAAQSSSNQSAAPRGLAGPRARALAECIPCRGQPLKQSPPAGTKGGGPLVGLLAIRLCLHLLPGLATHLHRLLGDDQLRGLRPHRRRLRVRLGLPGLRLGPHFPSFPPLGPPLGLARPPGRFGQLSTLHLTTMPVRGNCPRDHTIEWARRIRDHMKGSRKDRAGHPLQ